MRYCSCLIIRQVHLAWMDCVVPDYSNYVEGLLYPRIEAFLYQIANILIQVPTCLIKLYHQFLNAKS